MNNKKGGFGTKLVLVLILMLASAIGGAYCFRVFDGKMAVRDATKDIETIKISDYDTEEAAKVEGYISDAKKNLETAKTRKEVYDIMQEFNSQVDGELTRLEKELEAARKAANDASKNAGNNNSSSNDNDNSYNGYSNDNSYDNDAGTEEEESSGGLFGGLIGGGSGSDSDSGSGSSTGSSSSIFSNDSNN